MFPINWERLDAGVFTSMLPATKRKSRTFATRETDVISERKHCSRRRRHTQVELSSSRKCADKTQTIARKRWHGARKRKRSNVRSTCGRINMYAWYRQMYVTIRLHGALGQRLSIRRGTRQGGLSSPRTFNVFYGDLIDTISKSDRGISLRGETYSVFCYTDDLLIASTTSTGLQTLRYLCDSYPSTECGSTLRKQAAPL